MGEQGSQRGERGRADDAVAVTVQALLGVLAASAAVVGGWAQAAPASFYSDFPGLRRTWVSLDGPYNEHLIRDVGGLNLALAAVTAAAAYSAVRALAAVVSAAWLLCGAPHLAYHALHLEPFGTVDAVGQVIALAVQVAIPAYVLIESGTRPSDR